MKRLLQVLLVLLLAPSCVGAAEVALDGACAVCLIEAGKVVKGDVRHAVVFDRQTYLFPSEAERRMFAADPAKYAPALGGDCVVCRANMGVRTPGKVEFAEVHQRRLYLFPSAKEREAFRAAPDRYAATDVALQGQCSVCVVNAGKWVPGKPGIVSIYDGVRYFFPSVGEKRAFDADPARYAPALEGDCVVCLRDGGKRVSGAPQFSALHRGRLYLFPEAGAQKQFLSNPAAYADVDLAQGGDCVVCAKSANVRTPGSPAFTSIYKGRRYQFPSAKERAAFDASPIDFAMAEPTGKTAAGAESSAPARKSTTGAARSPAAVQATGKTACAGCEFGVRPLTDSDSLGLAVVTNGVVYVVEGAETRYPELFDARFDEVSVELQGTVRKRQGKFVWIDPTSLTRIR